VRTATRDSLPKPTGSISRRKNNSYPGFGAEAHACLGLHLSRMEAHIAFPRLLQRFPEIELRESVIPWTERLSLRGLKRLHVVLHARRNLDYD